MSRPPLSKTPRFTRYTPLNAPKFLVLQEALHADLLTTLRKGNSPPNADTLDNALHATLSFTNTDFKAINTKQDDPTMIKVEIECFAIKKVLVNQGSSIEILYWEMFKKLQILKDMMCPYIDER